MLRFYVYAAVVICGAAVLAIELLGTRIIAPFYGASIYLWSALIGVTLAALSLGYLFGGRIADRGAKVTAFSTIIGLSGVWIAVIPFAATAILAATEPLGLRTAVLISATVMFFPPLALLGMVSPYAIKLMASNLDQVGRTAGNLYAASTVASVIAALATGFFLIPNLGVHVLVFTVGLLLTLTALVGFVWQRQLKTAVSSFLLVLGAGFILARGTLADAASPENGLISIKQSAYAEIRVVDVDETRHMMIDGGLHTAIDPATWESHLPYTSVLDIPSGFFAQPGTMLLVGLGGGTVARDYASKKWQVDAVEIDPVVVQTAREFFGLNDVGATIFEMDGRQFFRSYDKTYDLIIMDAFGSSSIPFHLVTREAFELVRSHLAPNGVLAINLIAEGWRDAIVTSMGATLRSLFPHVFALPMAEPPNQLGNLILLASNRELRLINELPIPRDRFSPEYDRAHAWDNRFALDTSRVQLLTDDLNPVDIWSERINLASRNHLHSYLDMPGFTW